MVRKLRSDQWEHSWNIMIPFLRFINRISFEKGREVVVNNAYINMNKAYMHPGLTSSLRSGSNIVVVLVSFLPIG